MTLDEAIEKRRSVRDFDSREISMEEISFFFGRTRHN
jgi:nitroreductase